MGCLCSAAKWVSRLSATFTLMTYSYCCFRFKGAFVTVWEQEQCADIFGEMDVVADDLPALADGIIAATKD